jgi:hypothetical protein
MDTVVRSSRAGILTRCLTEWLRDARVASKLKTVEANIDAD